MEVAVIPTLLLQPKAAVEVESVSLPGRPGLSEVRKELRARLRGVAERGGLLPRGPD